MKSDADVIGLDVREVQMRLLIALDRVCREHGLRYWLEAGTLLGAARCQNFIPWDDDIDIAMPMADYRRFLKCAQSLLPDDIFLQTSTTDPAYRQAFAKLRDCGSTLVERHERFGEAYHQGIYLDIFPIVEYPSLPDGFRRWMCRLISGPRYEMVVAKRHSLRLMVRYAVGMFIWHLLFPFRGPHLGQTPEDNGYGCSMSVDLIYPLGLITFAKKEFPAPRNVAGYLTRMYGDSFLTPPPVTGRIRHSSSIHPQLPCFHARAINRSRDRREEHSFPPVAFFCYKNLDRVRRSLGALALNPNAAYTKLYVFSDGPSDLAGQTEVSAVREFLTCIKAFGSIEIIHHPSNMGIEKNIIFGVGHVLEHHDRVIVIEDDVVVSSTALDYFAQALELYRSQPRVMHVSGCAFVDRPDEGAYFSDYCEMWGWATWRDRWNHFVWYTSPAEALSGLSREAQEKLTFGGEFKCLSTLNANPIPWDICWALVIAKNRGVCLVPPVSLVENIGLKEGTHFGDWHGASPHPYQTSANEATIKKFPEVVESDVAAWTEMRQFYVEYNLCCEAQRPGIVRRVSLRLMREWSRLRRLL